MELSGPLQWLYLKLRLAHLGKNCELMRNIRVKHPRHIWVGDQVLIGQQAFLYAHPRDKSTTEPIIRIGDRSVVNERVAISAQAGIVIEERVGLSPYVMIQDHTHGYTDINLPILDHPVDKIQPIRIGAESWLGVYAAVLPGGSVGRHCVIGMHAVVNTPIPDYCVAVGSPAHIVKHYDFEQQAWVKGPPPDSRK